METKRRHHQKPKCTAASTKHECMPRQARPYTDRRMPHDHLTKGCRHHLKSCNSSMAVLEVLSGQHIGGGLDGSSTIECCRGQHHAAQGSMQYTSHAEQLDITCRTTCHHQPGQPCSIVVSQGLAGSRSSPRSLVRDNTSSCQDQLLQPYDGWHDRAETEAAVLHTHMVQIGLATTCNGNGLWVEARRATIWGHTRCINKARLARIVECETSTRDQCYRPR